MDNGNNGNSSKKREHTCARIIEAIRESKGLLTIAARKAGLGYRTVCRYHAEFPSVQEAVQQAKEEMLDSTENKLFEQINANNMTAIIFYLKTQGKARGYIEQQTMELTGKHGGPIEQRTRIIFTPSDLAAAIALARNIGVSVDGVHPPQADD